MPLHHVALDFAGAVATVTLDHQEVMNALSPEMLKSLAEAFDIIAERRSEVRCVMLTGAGRAFCTGANLQGRGANSAGEHPLRGGAGAALETAFHPFLRRLRDLHCPLVTAINGPAAGAGLSLALACDTRICSEKAFLACAYGRIGASPDGGMTYFLPRVVGPSRAIELLLNDPNLTPQAALEEKLVSEVVPAEQLMERAREKAQKFAAKAPYFVRNAKRLIQTSLDHTLAEHLQFERHAIAEAMGTEDVKAAVTAFIDGRGDQVEFKGR